MIDTSATRPFSTLKYPLHDLRPVPRTYGLLPSASVDDDLVLGVDAADWMVIPSGSLETSLNRQLTVLNGVLL